MEVEKITKLETPCGVITVSDSSGNLIPFSLKPSTYNVPYEVYVDNNPTIVLTPEQNLHICISPSDIEKNKEYFIILEGTPLHFGGSDERSVCVTGSSNGYSIGLGAYIHNEEERDHQAYLFSKKMGYYEKGFIQDPPHFDESTFEWFDTEMLEDKQGFVFHRIDDTPKDIIFTTAWLSNELASADECEGAVDFWTT